MPYQKPKSDHPWRQYKSRKRKIKERADIVSIKIFLEEVVENWETYEITTVDMFEGSNRHPIKVLPQKKVAAWLAGVLRRNYVDY
jgi:hypothetical protein